MNSQTQLYSAQTIGNIEPIEYMIPYPGTQAIIEGQIIKYGDKSIFSDYNLKNIEFYELIQKMANWLTEQGINPKDNVVIEENSLSSVSGNEEWGYEGRPMTINDLFDVIEDKIIEDPFFYEITYNTEYGYPEYSYFDMVEMIADEEIGYILTNFKRL